MNIFKSKVLYIAPFVGLLIICLLTTAFMPAFNPKPKELPIAIVNLDKGIEVQGKTQNIGDTFVEKIEDNKDLRETAKFINVDSKEELKKGFADKKYYGAMVIPANFTADATSMTRSEVQKVKIAEGQKQAEKAQKDLMAQVQSGKISPAEAKAMGDKMKQEQEAMMAKNKDAMKPIEVKQGQIEVMMNQGASTQAATISDTMLTKMTENLNAMVSKNTVDTLQKEKVTLSAAQAENVSNPVTVKHTTINKVKDHQAMGNAPMLLFTPVWLGSLVTSVMLYFAFRQSNLIGRKNRLIGSIGQIVTAMVSALFGGYIGLSFTTHVLKLDVTNPAAVYLYVSIAMFGFIMLILGLMSWLGMGAIPLFMLLLFFSMQMLTLPKQMMPEFHQKYLYDWNPFKLYAEGLRELIYLGKDLTFNTPMQMYLWLGIIGIILIVASSQIKKHKGKRTEIPAG